MNIQKIDIDKLIPALYNPRKNLKPDDREYQKIKRSIEEFGYVDPVIVNSDYTVIGGHQRLKVLKVLGYTSIDCVMVDVDKEKEKALNIALNKISGEWDLPLLKDLLEELDTGSFDIELTGFDEAEIEQLMRQFHVDEVEEDNFNADDAYKNIVEPVTKRGDIWQLGRHRLMCGDSTSIDDVKRLMDGNKANLIVTDPPYNVDYTGKTKEALKIQNDKINNFYEFLVNAFTNMFLILDDGAPIYIFYADKETINFRKAFEESGFHYSTICIWAKQSLVLSQSDYHIQHEPIIYGWKPTSNHKWYSDRKQTTLWNFDRPTASRLHPTMKPIDLVAYPIKNSTLSNSIVVDLFGGSGSTLIACEQTNRICYMLELDEKYCDVIIKRWEEYTGQKAVLINA